MQDEHSNAATETPGDDATFGRVVVEARHLDTDARTHEIFEVVVPAEPRRQRVQLEQLVATAHPEAKFRSFATGAATFVGPQHLVIAHYQDLPEPAAPVRARRLTQQSALTQDSLFAS